MPHNKPLTEQFWKHVAKGNADECWPWVGSCRPTGYGQMRRLGKNLKAHRVSWEIHNGPIPDGMMVCHRCDNPPCVNPTHLLLGTQTENLIDMRLKARASGGSMRGTTNPASKLTEAQVLELRANAENGMSFRALSRSFGLNKKTVAAIVRRETWQTI